MNDNKDVKTEGNSKKHKKISVYAVFAIIIPVFVLIVAIIASSLLTIAQKDPTYNMYTKVVSAFMPESYEDDLLDITFYQKLNPKYDGVKDPSNPANAFIFYYKDKSGKEVDLTGGLYYENKTDRTPTVVSLVFFVKMQQNLQKIVNIVKTVCIILAVIELALFIVLWYRAWSRKQNKLKADIYDNNKSQK